MSDEERDNDDCDEEVEVFPKTVEGGSDAQVPSPSVPRRETPLVVACRLLSAAVFWPREAS